MTKDENKIPFTFRINKTLNDRIEKAAAEMGVSKTAFITMTLHKSMNLEKEDKQ